MLGYGDMVEVISWRRMLHQKWNTLPHALEAGVQSPELSLGSHHDFLNDDSFGLQCYV